MSRSAPTRRQPKGQTVSIPPLGLGCAPIGGLYAPVSETEAQQTVSAALAGGIRYFDTAPHYGAGLSERRLGQALRGADGKGVTISTKVGRTIVPPLGPGDVSGEHVGTGTVADLSYDAVRRSLDTSLARLGIDRVDIVFVHDPIDADAAIDGAFRALLALRDQGVITAVGAGMNTVRMLTRFAREVDIDCLLVAGRYTLLDQSALEELMPTCVSHGVQVIAAGVFNTGILADPRPGAYFDYRPAPRHLLDRARKLQRVCLDHGVPLAAAAIQFPVTHPAVRSVVVGARSAGEVSQAVVAARQPIPADLWPDLVDQGLLVSGVVTP